MKVDGLDIDVGVEGVLIEEDCTTCVMGHVEAICEKLVVDKVMTCHLPAICCSKASSFCRRVPGFQL